MFGLQICHLLCQALALYFRAHLAQTLIPGQQAAPIPAEGLEAFLAAQLAAATAEAVGTWSCVDGFLKLRGPSYMLDIIKLCPHHRWHLHISPHAPVPDLSTADPALAHLSNWMSGMELLCVSQCSTGCLNASTECAAYRQRVVACL